MQPAPPIGTGTLITILHVIEEASEFRDSTVVSILGEAKWKRFLKSSKDKIIPNIPDDIETF